jgi:ATP-binding cassette subfamily B protein
MARHGGVIQKPKNFSQSLKKLTVYAKKQGKGILFSVFLAAISAVFSILGPLYLGKITDILHISLKYSTPLDIGAISKIGIMLSCFYVVSAIADYCQGFVMSKVSGKISSGMRNDIAQKLNRLPLKFYDKHTVGDTMSKITNDVSTISTTLSQSFATAIIAVVKAIGFLVIMFIISWQLTLITLVSVPLTFFVVSLVMKKSQKYFVAQQQSLGDLNGHAEETYSAHEVVRVFNAENKMIEKFEKINNQLSSSTLKSTFISNIVQPLSMFFSNITYLIVCLVGASLVFEGSILIGAIASFVIYIRQFNQPISQIASIAGTLQSTVAAAERVFDLLEEPEEDSEKDKQPTFKDKQVEGRVEFKNVWFGYYESKPVIKDFSLVVEPGQKIAIVGPTGAGKTTLINLLMRFYEVQQGEILIDGVPTNQMRRKDVRKLFGMVLQDSWVFEGTIKENISYGVSKITMEEIEQASQLANIDHFIKTLPNAYNTVLDDNTSFSQGQKQLLTIARATIQNAPMLILDEATSSVDTRTEVLIQQAMDRLTQNRTSFVIAHRLSTIKNADKIIVMRDGKIVEVGNHDQLLQANGFYAELYNSQFDE